ncbi:MAG TPA: hypothetical protein VFZ28_10080 [Burkholderiaceae bacterium]|nr:hypothetical protein [Burkholderiaceae bacterium]
MIDRSTNRRLQLATRIHYALLRETGIGADVGRLLKRPLYARDVLLVCEACGDAHDLRRLATAFRAASLLAAAEGTRGAGFGASQGWSSSLLSMPPESVPAE